MLDTTLILSNTDRLQAHARDQQLKRFRYFKGRLEVGRATEQESSAYVGCPTDSKLACDISRNGEIMRSAAAVKKRRDFDPNAFLATIGEGRKFVLFQETESLCARGYR